MLGKCIPLQKKNSLKEFFWLFWKKINGSLWFPLSSSDLKKIRIRSFCCEKIRYPTKLNGGKYPNGFKWDIIFERA